MSPSKAGHTREELGVHRPHGAHANDTNGRLLVDGRVRGNVWVDHVESSRCRQRAVVHESVSARSYRSSMSPEGEVQEAYLGRTDLQ